MPNEGHCQCQHKECCIAASLRAIDVGFGLGAPMRQFVVESVYQQDGEPYLAGDADIK